MISAYRVSQTYSSEAGYTTAFMQQARAYIKANISNPKPKQRCLVNLAKFIEQWKSTHTDSSIILMMDANGDGSDTHLYTFIRDTTLQDVIAHYAPDFKGRSTYINGQTRLDCILVSADLLGSSNKAGHTAFLQPFILDHRGVYWDVAVDDLFDSHHGGAKPVIHRGLQLEKPATVEEYTTQLHILYDRYRVLHRMQKIEANILATTDQHTLQHLYSKFNALDLERIRYMKRAEALRKQR